MAGKSVASGRLMRCASTARHEPAGSGLACRPPCEQSPAKRNPFANCGRNPEHGGE